MEKKKKTSAPGPENLPLAQQAERAVRDDKFIKRSGRCQQFVRQNIQAENGDKYDAYHKGTAEQSRLAWKASPYAVDPARGSVVGDILYKKAQPGQPYGHVGIRVPGNRVAENSSTTRGRVSGAKGFRTLEQFGKVDLIVRLPVAKK